MSTKSKILEPVTRTAIVYQLAKAYADLPQAFLIDAIIDGEIPNFKKVEEDLLVDEFESHCIDWDYPPDHNSWTLLEDARVQLQIHKMLTEKQG